MHRMLDGLAPDISHKIHWNLDMRHTQEYVNEECLCVIPFLWKGKQIHCSETVDVVVTVHVKTLVVGWACCKYFTPGSVEVRFSWNIIRRHALECVSNKYLCMIPFLWKHIYICCP